MEEDKLVTRVLAVAQRVLPRRFAIRRGASLLYEVIVNNRLEITANPKRPSRGHSAFQTDLCVLERLGKDLEIPRVVLEFKAGLSTHDVLTYSAKARRHKQVYPYLRYGLVVARSRSVPRRFFPHNEALDFCVAAGAFNAREVPGLVARLALREVRASRLLERIAYGGHSASVFRTAVVLSGRH